MEISYLKAAFAAVTFLTVFLGLLINCFETYLPAFFSQIYRYGKFSYKGSSRKWTLQVPKRWFKHFYLFGSIWSTLVFLIILCVFLNYVSSPPSYFKWILDSVDSHRTSTVSSASVFVASFLLMIQCWRRFYETHYVSVFSPGMMDLSHYFLGFLHYFGAATAIAIEAPGFSSLGNDEIRFRSEDLNLVQYAAITAFLWAWIVQYDCACILANLRKNAQGEVVTVKHKIPQGRMFNLVSCPHQLCEIVMYICLSLILWGNTTFLFILAWVLANQIAENPWVSPEMRVPRTDLAHHCSNLSDVETAMLSHWWYKAQFPNYPKSRRALVPFIL